MSRAASTPSGVNTSPSLSVWRLSSTYLATTPPRLFVACLRSSLEGEPRERGGRDGVLFGSDRKTGRSQPHPRAVPLHQDGRGSLRDAGGSLAPPPLRRRL